MLNGLRSILQLQMCAVAKPGTFPRRGQSENTTSVGDQLKCANKIGGPSHIKVTERFNSIPKGGEVGLLVGHGQCQVLVVGVYASNQSL